MVHAIPEETTPTSELELFHEVKLEAFRGKVTLLPK